MPERHAKRRLVIVESPTKARTISRYLPREYQVEASMGHVRDLPASAAEIPAEHKGASWARLGVQVEDGFKPLYVVSPRKRDVVRKLRRALKDADELLIATDEDREGESIGWHLVELLEPSIPVRRMVFHEITREAIERALDDTRDIDLNLVDAQETRRVLDRLVGYTISPLLWKKIAPKLSAGRVQSVAVRLLVQREQERIAFRSGSYWDLEAQLRGDDGAAFGARLTHVGDRRVASGRDFDERTGALRDTGDEASRPLLLGETGATALAAALQGGTWTVREVESRDQTRSPAAPFTTSTLQQEASRKLNLPARDTMRVAQGLYERGFITYMRTDSTTLSQEALTASRAAIEARYGTDYLADGPRTFASRAKGAQEAHEAIRPAGTDMRTSDEHGLQGVDAALYDLIWKRTVASQMADARIRFVTARIDARASSPVTPGNAHAPADAATFRATGRTVLFPGFFRAYVEGSDDPEATLDERDQPLPPLDRGQGLVAEGVKPLGHETKPPARYTEASLVKLLEQEGIGRPSTYASIIDTIQRRGYARKQGSQLVPTFVAFATTRLLERQFRELVDTEFTATMEASLDEIAAGSVEAVPYLRAFYTGPRGLEASVAQGLEGIDAREINTVRTDAWDPYVVRVGRYGPYVEGEVDGEAATASLPGDVAPADLTRDDLERMLRQGREGALVVGTAETGEPMLLKRGPYGPYLQLGEPEEGVRPKRVSLPKTVAFEDVDEPLARALLALPRALGDDPERGTIEAGIGRFGPYVRAGSTFASIPKGEDVLTIGLDRARELLDAKRARSKVRRELGPHPESGDPVEVRDGKYGPYVSHGKVNASLRDEHDPDAIDMATALALLAEREAAAPAKGRGRSQRRASGTKSAGAKGDAAAKARTGAKGRGAARRTAGKGTKAKADRPKATTADLERHLDELDTRTREVVVRLEGMAGQTVRSVDEVADDLDLSGSEVERMRKSGLFKLRMAFGKARGAEERGSGR